MRGILGMFNALAVMLTFAGCFVAQLGVTHANPGDVGGGLAAAAGGAMVLFCLSRLRR